VYLIAVCSWGLVFLNLLKVLMLIRKNKEEVPPLLFHLVITSVSLLIENVYFGIYFFLEKTSLNNLDSWFFDKDKWLIVHLFVAISGLLLLLDIKKLRKGNGKK
jgi:hypothetical protein